MPTCNIMSPTWQQHWFTCHGMHSILRSSLLFSTVLSNDNSISESSKITRKVSRRHPVISLDDDADLEKASLQSGKHKLDDDDDVDEDKGVTSENKRFKKIRQTAAESGRSNLPGCSKSLQKFLSAVSSTSSDDESRSSDASRRSRSFKKDSNDKVRFGCTNRATGCF